MGRPKLAMRPPLDPLAETGMHLAGPAVNVLLCLLTGAALATQGSTIPLALLIPELGFGGPSWELGCQLTFWINWLLISAFFSGSRAVMAP